MIRLTFCKTATLLHLNFITLSPHYLITSVILYIFSVLSVPAQIPTGAWRDHLPYSQCIKVVEAGGKIYCATNYNIFTHNTIDNSIEKLSKITGLSDIGISTMEYYQKQ